MNSSLGLQIQIPWSEGVWEELQWLQFSRARKGVIGSFSESDSAAPTPLKAVNGYLRFLAFSPNTLEAINW